MISIVLTEMSLAVTHAAHREMVVLSLNSSSSKAKSSATQLHDIIVRERQAIIEGGCCIEGHQDPIHSWGIPWRERMHFEEQAALRRIQFTAARGSSP